MDYAAAHNLFAVVEATGALIWKVRTGPRSRVGVRAGRVRPDGYRYVKTGGKQYLEHRVVWLLTYGEWPVGEIDHINSIRDDNRPCNLRLASRSENNRHAWKATRDLPKGVVLQNGRYIASIMVNKRRFYLGSFVNPDTAKAAYDKAAIGMHGEFAAL